MLKKHLKARLHDSLNDKDVDLEVNFAKTGEMKNLVRITVGSEELMVPLDELYTFVFTVVDSTKQVDLIRMKEWKVKKLIRSHIVAVGQDMKKGQEVTIKCVTDVPAAVFEALANMKEDDKPKDNQ